MDVKVWHNWEIFYYEFFRGVFVGVIPLQESCQHSDLLVVEVSPDEERMICNFPKVHQHPHAAVHAASSFDCAFRQL